MDGRLEHVVVYTGLFPNSRESEKGRFISQLVDRLRRRLKVTVVSPIPWFPRSNGLKKYFPSKGKYADIPSTEVWHNCTAYYPRHPVIPALGFLTPFIQFLSVVPLIKRLHREQPVDLIHAHWVFPDGVAAARVGNLLRIPVLLTARGCDINLYPALKFRKRQIQHALNRCGGVTAVSRDLCSAIETLGVDRKRIAFIPNGVDDQLFHPLDRAEVRSRLGCSTSGRIVLFIGSLDKVKGTRYLLEAVSLLSRAPDRPLSVWVIGSGPLDKMLQEYAAELGIADIVRFWGNQPHEMMSLFLNAADILCLPSIREGSPNVIMEAIACGIPVVASRVGGIPELVIPDVNGYLHESGNAADLAEGLNRALSRDWERETIRSTFSGMTWEKCAAVYLQQYDKALRKELHV